MSRQLLGWFTNPRSVRHARRSRTLWHPTSAFESLETRVLLSATTLAALSKGNPTTVKNTSEGSCGCSTPSVEVNSNVKSSECGCGSIGNSGVDKSNVEEKEGCCDRCCDSCCNCCDSCCKSDSCGSNKDSCGSKESCDDGCRDSCDSCDSCCSDSCDDKVESSSAG